MAVRSARQKAAVSPKKATPRTSKKRTATGAPATAPAATAATKATKATKAKPTGRTPAKSHAPSRSRPTRRNGGRYSAPKVTLGMTPPEVRECAGQPECILFGAEDHVEWQFGQKGVDAVGAPTLYVTTLTFAAGRVIQVTERMAEAI